jgi:methyl-accepting chemotaxis protein
MTAEAERISYRSGPQAKRRLRNYLLVPSFQLKYTAMVVGVTVVVASVLGIVAYDYSSGQTQILSAQRLEAKGTDADERFLRDLEHYGRVEDRKVALGIAGAVALLTFVLGFTGIMVTHRLVGPAYRLKQLLREVRDGHLRVDGRLRKHDELQDLFVAFQDMVLSLRTMQEKEIAQLEAAIEQAQRAGLAAGAIEALVATRDRMRAALD